MAARKTPVAVMAFPLEEAARLSHLNPARLRDWARDLYGPQRGGALYTFRDLVALRTLGDLREKRVSKHQLKRIGTHLRSKDDEPWSRLTFGIGPKNVVYFKDPATGRWLSADGKEQSITPYALDHIARELEQAVRRARQRDPSTVGRLQQKPGVQGNVLRIAGTRIPVSVVEEWLREGSSEQQILRNFPDLRAADIAAVRKHLAA